MKNEFDLVQEFDDYTIVGDIDYHYFYCVKYKEGSLEAHYERIGDPEVLGTIKWNGSYLIDGLPMEMIILAAEDEHKRCLDRLLIVCEKARDEYRLNATGL